MKPHIRRSASLLAVIVAAVSVIGAAQAAKFPTGTIKGGDGTNNFSLQFDTAGVINVYVNDQFFSSSKYESKMDTVKFGPLSAPDGNGCAGSGTYLWKLTENRMSFTTVADDCQLRMTTLTGVAWTRG